MKKERGSGKTSLQPSDLGRFIGCIGIAAAVLLAGVALLFWIGGRYQQEWANARPAGITDRAWQERKALCEEAKMAPAECGTSTPREIEVAAALQREKARQELCAEEASYDAMEQAKKAVSGSLKAPSTAKWSNVRATQSGCDWRVTGNVDAQNAFGGMMRSSFEVSLRRASRQTWVPLSVSVQ